MRYTTIKELTRYGITAPKRTREWQIPLNLYDKILLVMVISGWVFFAFWKLAEWTWNNFQ